MWQKRIQSFHNKVNIWYAVQNIHSRSKLVDLCIRYLEYTLAWLGETIQQNHQFTVEIVSRYGTLSDWTWAIFKCTVFFYFTICGKLIWNYGIGVQFIFSVHYARQSFLYDYVRFGRVMQKFVVCCCFRTIIWMSRNQLQMIGTVDFLSASQKIPKSSNVTDDRQ